MTPERFADFESRLRKVEDLLIRLDAIIELIHKMDNRVNTLEKHDEEFMAMVHTTCTLKDKDIQKNRDEAIKISTEHANSNHKQTLAMIVFMFTMFVGAVVYFNGAVGTANMVGQKNSTSIDSIGHTLDRIDGKLDGLSSDMRNHK